MSTNYSRKVGRFRVHSQLARDFDTTLKRIMSRCIVVRAEQHFASDEIEYVAVSDLFREVKNGEIVPEYVWTCNTDGYFWCTELAHTGGLSYVL